LSQEDLIKNATNLPFPEEHLLYQTEVATQKNVLIVGKAGVGKTTLFEVLKDPNYKTSTSYSFFCVRFQRSTVYFSCCQKSKRKSLFG